MNKKLLIITVTIVVTLVALIYVLKPSPVTAPIEDLAIETEQTASTTPHMSTSTPETELQNNTDEQTTSSIRNTPTEKPATTYTPQKTAAALPYIATIVYTGTRFIPEEVVIIEGGTVQFINQSESKMWIASDLHPKHDKYPVKSDTDCAGSSFDQCASVGTSGTWSFVFTEVGTWGFHNHVRAQDTGKVIVRTVAQYKEEYQ